MLNILIFLVVILFIVHVSIHNSRVGKLINKIPGPPIVPVVGNILDIFMGPLQLFYETRNLANSTSHTINKYWIFNMPVVSVYDPDDMEVILSSVKNINKSYVYDFTHPWLNDGLLVSTGQKWQKRRKILTPTFHFNILKDFCTVLVENSEKFVQKLKGEVGRSETEILPHVTEFALNSICETAMGTNLDTNQSNAKTYKDAIYTFGENMLYRFARPWLYPSMTFNLTSIGKKQKEVLKTLHGFTTEVIRERRIERNVSGNKFETENSFDIETTGKKKRLAMLDLLLSAEIEKEIDEDGIREEVDTFMFEGHDTTTMAITFCLMLIANHPDIQEKIVEELNEIFYDANVPTTIEELNKLRYLERCIKEALRLYPSVPYIGRMLTEDLQLKNYILPAGCTIDIHIFDMHRRADLYPNPDKFDPDRFLPENCVKRHPFAYIPFSAGPRNCIGQKFAILEEKSVISSILRKYKLVAVTRPDEIIFTTDLVLRSKDPIKIKFVNRV